MVYRRHGKNDVWENIGTDTSLVVGHNKLLVPSSELERRYCLSALKHTEYTVPACPTRVLYSLEVESSIISSNILSTNEKPFTH